MADSVPQPPNTVGMLFPETGTKAWIPKENAQKAHAKGWVVDVESAHAPEVHAGQASVLGGAQGATSGFLDELAGAAQAAKHVPEALAQHSTAPVTLAYTNARNAARDTLASAREQNPVSYTAGQLVGGVPSAFAMPGGSIVGGAVSGAAQALGDTPDITNVGQVAKDVAHGAGIGAGAGAVLHGVGALGQSAAPTLENAAGKSLLTGANLLPEAVGAKNWPEAIGVAKQALKEPGLVPSPFGQPATAANLAARAQKTLPNAGQALEQTYREVQGNLPGHISARAIARDIAEEAQHAVSLKPELSRHVARAINALDPEGFKSAYEAARAVNPKGAKQLLETQPWRFIDPKKSFTLEEAQDVLNNLKGLGAYKEGSATSTELNAKQDVYSPAWSQAAEHLRQGAESLGGPEARNAVEAARSRYGANAAFTGVSDPAKQAPPPSLVDQLKLAGGAAGLGSLLPGHAPLTAGLLAGGTLAARHLIPPRAGAALQGVANSAQQGFPAVQNLGGAFARLFEGKSPEDQATTMHKLLEISPEARKKMQGGPVDPSGRID